MKKIIKKISDVLEIVFGYGVMISLFVGGLTFFGYLVALVVSGETGALICEFIHKTMYPYLVYATSVIVLIGIIKMYLCGETALKASSKEKK